MLYLFSSNVWHVFPQGQGYDTNSELSPAGTCRFLASAVPARDTCPRSPSCLSSIGGWLLGMRNMMVSTCQTTTWSRPRRGAAARGRIMIGYAARNAVPAQRLGLRDLPRIRGQRGDREELVFSYPGLGEKAGPAVNKQ